ncbi:MAG TPA: hypothetical protein VGO98_00710 [Candidatus Saccharimonadales bacterium]|jgi:hypothetical protein|nr:hypothetical protein [Candidatus Saccharimonadales bacterium]
MIEINLVPDVKQELINAQRVRTNVISIAILVGLAAIGIVVVLAVWVFAVQTARGFVYDKTITEESQKLSQVPDLSNTLTIQNQLNKLSAMHNDKHINSRLFDVLAAINPQAPNTVTVSNVSLDSATKTIKIEAQAESAYPGLEVFKKTINAAKFEYAKDGEKQSVPLASEMSHSDLSYGDDVSGIRVLRFTVNFVYPDELFSQTVENPLVVLPSRTNVTDSFLGVPNSLFSPKAVDAQGDN